MKRNLKKNWKTPGSISFEQADVKKSLSGMQSDFESPDALI